MRGLDRTEAMLAALRRGRPAAGGRSGTVRRRAGGRRARDRRGHAPGRGGQRVSDRLPGGGGGDPAGRVVRRALGLAHRGAAALHRRPRRPRTRPRGRRVRQARRWGERERARFDRGDRAARRAGGRPDDRRPPQAAPQDPRADQHQGGAYPGGARRGALGGGLGGDPVIGQPGHRGAQAGEGGRRLPAPPQAGHRPGSRRAADRGRRARPRSRPATR